MLDSTVTVVLGAVGRFDVTALLFGSVVSVLPVGSVICVVTPVGSPPDRPDDTDEPGEPGGCVRDEVETFDPVFGVPGPDELGPELEPEETLPTVSTEEPADGT